MTQLQMRGIAVIVGIALSLAAAPAFSADKASTWSYGGATGPAKWSTLDKSYDMCTDGQLQSPIDIPEAKARKGALPSLLFDYQPSPLNIVDTGKMIRVNYAPGSFVRVAGKKYELQQINFHKPGEEKVNGKGHDMGVHLVHRAPDKTEGIVAVMLDAGAGNALVKAVLDNLPKDKNKESAVGGATINAMDLLPKNKGYFTFSGSQTSPPCTEDVTWFVMKTPVTVSADQVARFGRSYPMNARPVQPLNARDIQSTD